MERAKFFLIAIITIKTIYLSAQTSGTFTDPRDGKNYKTLLIGNQTWMIENLAYKPASGNCWSYDNNDSTVANYGYLYDWETAKTVCPKGWHLPCDAEWYVLTEFLNLEGKYGDNLFTSAVDDVDISKVDYESDLVPVYSGCRYRYGKFYSLDYLAYWWSSTEMDADNIAIRSMYSGSDKIYRSIYNKDCGFAVRCIKD